jgi:hypothetical protein
MAKHASILMCEPGYHLMSLSIVFRVGSVLPIWCSCSTTSNHLRFSLRYNNGYGVARLRFNVSLSTICIVSLSIVLGTNITGPGQTVSTVLLLKCHVLACKYYFGFSQAVSRRTLKANYALGFNVSLAYSMWSLSTHRWQFIMV